MKPSNLLLSFLLFLSYNSLQAQYCTPTANCSLGDGVTLFTIGPFSNESGCEADMGVDGYADFTALTGLTLGQGVTYESQFQSQFGNQQFSIWIDTDFSESFESSELIMTDLEVGTAVTTTDITIPTDIPLGMYRLRIKANYFAASSEDACLSTTFGETEDYLVTIVAPPSCLNVSAVNASDISATSATIGWTDSGAASAWDVEWGLAGFEPSGIPSPGYDDISNPALLSGLNAVTEYDVYVRADCGMDNETDVSVWTSAYTFLTACGATTPTYIEDFNDGLGECWDVFADGDLVTGPLPGDYPIWFDDGFANTPNLFTGSQGISLFNTGENHWLVSPDIDLSADGPFQVEFDLSITAAFSQEPASLDPNDQVHILISTDFGSTWTTLQSWDEDAGINPSGEHLNYDLSPYDGQISRFAFWVSSGIDGDYSSFNVFVDNFIVQPVGSPIAVELEQVIEADCFFFGNALADALINVSGGVSPYSFLWSNGSTTEDLIDAEEGDYFVTITDGAGAVFVSDSIFLPGTPMVTVTAIITDESVDGANDGAIEIVDIEGGDGNYTFYWNNGASTQSIEGLINALWCVQITDGDGCATDTCFEVMQGLPPSALSELDRMANLTVFPNPMSNGISQMTADLSSGSEWSLHVVDQIGRIVFQEQLNGTTSHSSLLDLSGYSKGIYSLRLIRLDDGEEIQRLIVR